MNDEENFLSRWSKRKLSAKAEAAADAPQAPALPATEPSASPAAGTELPVPAPPENGAKPEYREFFDPQVDEALRRTALRKLFSDPHFNVMDGLDTYIDDYSKPDPIPEAMLRQLNQAKNLFLFDDEEKERARNGDELPAGDGKTPVAPPASAASPQAELAAPTGATSAADAPAGEARLQPEPRIGS